MTNYKAFLLNEIDRFIAEAEQDPRVYVQGNVIAARDSREVIEQLNQVQACKVVRKITAAEAVAGSPVHPVDYPAFAAEVAA